MLANVWETQRAFEDWSIQNNKLCDLGATSVRQRIVCLPQRSKAGMGGAFATPQLSCHNEKGNPSQSARCCSQAPQDPKGFMPATAACSKVITPETRKLLSPGCCRQSAVRALKLTCWCRALYAFEAGLLMPLQGCQCRVPALPAARCGCFRCRQNVENWVAGAPAPRSRKVFPRSKYRNGIASVIPMTPLPLLQALVRAGAPRNRKGWRTAIDHKRHQLHDYIQREHTMFLTQL